MMDIEELRVLIMTLPHTSHRYWYALGMLETLGYPIERCHTVMGRYWRDYEDMAGLISAMTEDGFPWAKRWDRWKTKKSRSFSAHMWSACRCLRWIAQQEHPVLLTEDDIRLVDYDTLYTSVSALPEDAEIVCLGAFDPTSDPIKQELLDSIEYLDGGWCRGSYPYASGAFVNIYTPAGARYALSLAEKEGHTLENLAHRYPKDTMYFRQPGNEVFVNVHTCLMEYSNHGVSDSETYMHEEFRGYGHYEFYDRWVDGLDVGVI